MVNTSCGHAFLSTLRSLMLNEKLFVKTETTNIINSTKNPRSVINGSNLSFVLFVELSNQIILTYCYKGVPGSCLMINAGINNI